MTHKQKKKQWWVSRAVSGIIVHVWIGNKPKCSDGFFREKQEGCLCLFGVFTTSWKLTHNWTPPKGRAVEIEDPRVKRKKVK